LYRKGLCTGNPVANFFPISGLEPAGSGLLLNESRRRFRFGRRGSAPVDKIISNGARRRRDIRQKRRPLVPKVIEHSHNEVQDNELARTFNKRECLVSGPATRHVTLSHRATLVTTRRSTLSIALGRICRRAFVKRFSGRSTQSRSEPRRTSDWNCRSDQCLQATYMKSTCLQAMLMRCRVLLIEQQCSVNGLWPRNGQTCGDKARWSVRCRYLG
jgi:hypothetical protein